MRTEAARAVRLKDYRAPDYLIDEVDLDVSLALRRTIVRARLSLRPNPAGRLNAPLVLDGDGLVATRIALDGVAIDAASSAVTPDSLTIAAPPSRAFMLDIETLIDPEGNTQLSGLYRSGGGYCTQCEAEGFRRITYFLDRPDVLARYTTRVEADKTDAPILLSNGNCVETGDVEGGERHYAVWRDPFPKPSYLFALVAGRFGVLKDAFKTASGRVVALGIFVEEGKEARAAYAMDALKRSMAWDERAFGREYDLDVFNIVAVPDFNMGAMENKGLNVFNDKYVLASPQTATDGDYAGIETVIAHEYFHNWTGNRITCRDWFQLCLKEGLTVFRDQEFSADERSRPVKRIADVRTLRAAQFPEDAGPLAHAVRPDTYLEINNFYTPTIYEKGAEIIRMLRMLIGAQAFRAGMDLYFERCDGSAATVEDFVACFAESSGRDLRAFMRWYAQAGTPIVSVTGAHDATARRFSLTFSQTTAPTPGQPTKSPLVIPIALGLLDDEGREIALRSQDANAHELTQGVFALDGASRTIRFEDVGAPPTPSLLRAFSAPVDLRYDYSERDLVTLIGADRDLFNRWEAAQTFAARLILRNVARLRESAPAFVDDDYLNALRRLLEAHAADPAFTALALTLPSELDLARAIGSDVDPDLIHAARDHLRGAIGSGLNAPLIAVYDALADSAPTPDAFNAGRRALRNVALDLYAAGDREKGLLLALAQFKAAETMTDRMGALAVLGRLPSQEREDAFDAFYARFQDDALVVDKWFALQATIPESDALDRVERLMRHPAFHMSNPNRLRALVGNFASANPTQFHASSGRGYAFLASIVTGLDAKNPQVAARLLGAFRSWRSMEPTRRSHAQAALASVAAIEGLSPDVRDIVDRSLA